MGQQHVSDDRTLALSQAEAFTALLVGCVAVDGVLRDDEARRLNETLASARWTFGAGVGTAASASRRALTLIADHGLAVVIDVAAATIPKDLRPTVFALATDLVLADGRLGSHERAAVDRLQDALEIEPALARTIVDVMLIKNRASGRPDL